MWLLGLYVLNAWYAFDGTFTRLGDYRFVSQTLRGEGTPEGHRARGNRFAGTWVGALAVPLPKDYVAGIDEQKEDFEQLRHSYLRGEIRRGGWWYYYLYALAVKVPLGAWALILLAGILLVGRGPQYAAHWRDEAVLLAPLIVVLVFVSAETGFGHHLRYVLPIFPYAMIWISRLARSIELRQWVVASLGGAALVWSLASSLSVYPHSISYFNELAGGPRGGHNHLLHSNIDWSQDLLYLKTWCDEHPEAQPFHLAYYGYTDPRIAGIDFTLPPELPPQGRAALDETSGLRPGWHAVSVQALRGMPCLIADGDGNLKRLTLGCYTYFLRFEPVATAGYSIYIYHVTLEEANRVRRELDLRELLEDP